MSQAVIIVEVTLSLGLVQTCSARESKFAKGLWQHSHVTVAPAPAAAAATEVRRLAKGELEDTVGLVTLTAARGEEGDAGYGYTRLLVEERRRSLGLEHGDLSRLLLELCRESRESGGDSVRRGR